MDLTIEQALQKAVEAHKAGQIQEADRLYTAILKAQPKHPDANHNLGVLAVSVGKAREALPFFKAALEANPSVAQFWLSYIEALIKLEKLEDAKSVLNQAKGKGAKGDGFDKLERRLQKATQLSLKANQIATEPQPKQPNILDSLKLDQALKLAKKKEKAGLTIEAKSIYRDILTKFPKNTKAVEGLKTLQTKKSMGASHVEDPPQDQVQSLIDHYNKAQLQQALQQADFLIQKFPKSALLYNILGAVLKGLGQLDSSVEAYKKALAIKPDYAEAYNNMGVSLRERGTLEEALEAHKKALDIQPDYADAYYNMGNAIKEQGRLKEAIDAYKKALDIQPDYAEAHNNIGLSLNQQGKLEDALRSYNTAIAIKPDYAFAHNNIGNALQEQKKLEQALEAYSMAIATEPVYAEPFNNMGVALQELGRPLAAIDAFCEALSLKPDYMEALENISNLRVQLSETVVFNEDIIKRFNYQNAEMVRMPKFQIQEAIRAFLLNDQSAVFKHLNNYISCDPELAAKLGRKNQIFCSAYYSLLLKLINHPTEAEPSSPSAAKIFHLGESHCLSYAHKNIYLAGVQHTIVPKITFGGKAFHFSREIECAFKAITKYNFDSIPNGSIVLISFGEIDCRHNEGFIKTAVKQKTSIETLITNTVHGYLKWFSKQNAQQNNNLYFLNVPAPMYQNDITVELNSRVARTVREFNMIMKKYSKLHNFKLIDVYKFTSNEHGYSNKEYHIDDKHLGPKAIPLIEAQLN